MSAGGWDKFMKNGSFSIKEMYKHLQSDLEKVSWSRVLCQNQASPRSLFTTWLAVNNRLPTRDRLAVWGIVAIVNCCLCNAAPESVEHLFFQCDFSAQIWSMALKALQFNRNPSPFSNELAWAFKSAKRRFAKHQLFLMYFAESLYAIWLYRNDQIFNQNHINMTAAVLFREISFKVAC
ncbi:uncharacterized protein LOC110692214 [Chenopodium quinoa]|uniref:uncharacterized protein LOC110692214 n=1 Tax=Chenopodium quinoa TaxID=63459 RepID=UPI000B78FD3F|nr:uncharacterized protein LOC110692214 [Chenopodium quinoa]